MNRRTVSATLAPNAFKLSGVVVLLGVWICSRAVWAVKSETRGKPVIVIETFTVDRDHPKDDLDDDELTHGQGNVGTEHL